jgi:hypothetical protein
MAEYKNLIVQDETPEAIITLSLELKGGEGKTEYVFYVPPEQVDVNIPSRVAVYQSISGTTYIDHLGEGVPTINLTGTTGFTRGVRGARRIGLNYLQYMFLKEIVSKYNEYCRQGKAEITDFILTIAFPDAPDYGQWRVTVKDLTLSRNANAPMLFRYQLSLICLTGNMQQINVEPLPEVIDTEDNTVVVRAPDIIKVAPEGASVTADVASAATGAAAASDTGTSSGAGKAAMANPAAIAAANQAAAQVHNPLFLFSYTVPEYNLGRGFQYNSSTGSLSGNEYTRTDLVTNVSIGNSIHYDSADTKTHHSLFKKGVPFNIQSGKNSIILALFFWKGPDGSLLDITNVRTIGNVDGNPNQEFTEMGARNENSDNFGNSIFWKAFYLKEPHNNSGIIFSDGTNSQNIPAGWSILAKFIKFDNVWADKGVYGGIDFSYNNNTINNYADYYIDKNVDNQGSSGAMLYEVCVGIFYQQNYDMDGLDNKLDKNISSTIDSFAYLTAFNQIRGPIDLPLRYKFKPKNLNNVGAWVTSGYYIKTKPTAPPFNAGQINSDSWLDAPRSINQVVKFFWGFTTTDSQEFRDARSMFVKLNPETGNLIGTWDEAMPTGTTVWIPYSFINKNKSLSFNKNVKERTVENPISAVNNGYGN